jgi:hypothetical protein
VGREASGLESLVATELAVPAPAAAVALAGAIRRELGDAVVAVAFYGSCLRRRTDEGVLDFYAIVDSYAAAYRKRRLAWLNAWLPPNVFYLEVDAPPTGTLRSKYAVISRADFEAGVAPGARRTGIWARFCQPTTVAWARDDATRAWLAGCVARAVETAVEVGLPLLPGEGPALAFRAEELWQTTLRETYAAEMRAESPETIRTLYDAAPERFDHAARLALDVLAAEGRLRWQEADGAVRVELDPALRARAARAWRRRRPLRKAIYLFGLLKSAVTFGDWLGYVLWKLERHSGRHIEVSERQRRHPLVFGWPVLWRVLRERTLR